MQVSSAYDFENFSKKIEKLIAINVNIIKKNTDDYLLQREHDLNDDIALWLSQSENEWDQEKNSQKEMNRHIIESQMNAEWSAFIKERRSVVREALITRLEEIFPSLAECFISTIIQKYESGTFTMPERYSVSGLKEGYVLKDSQKDEIIFTSGNLYIEYSVERILEELEDELTSYFNIEDEKWQR